MQFYSQTPYTEKLLNSNMNRIYSNRKFKLNQKFFHDELLDSRLNTDSNKPLVKSTNIIPSRRERLPSINNKKSKLKDSMIEIKESTNKSNSKMNLPIIKKNAITEDKKTLDINNKELLKNVYLYNFCNKFFEMWFDIDVNYDKENLIPLIKTFFINNQEYMKTFNQNYDSLEIFADYKFNLFFLRIIKLQIIISTVVLVLKNNFPYDEIIDKELKKLIDLTTIQILSFYEIYINGKCKYNQIIFDKMTRIKKSSKKLYKGDALIHINKNLENCFSNLKKINKLCIAGNTNGFFGIYSSIIKQYEYGITLYKIFDLITNCVIYCILYIDILNLKSNDFTLINSQQYLPQMDTKYKYTLILDLDETLAHYIPTYSSFLLLLRPYVIEFLSELCQLYEIVIFTASTKVYADTILNFIDPKNIYIKHRLYREHTTILNNGLVKDLSRLGRDLEKTIIIDNLSENFILHKKNGIACKTWKDDIGDTELLDLKKILSDIYKYNIKDVRKPICRIKEYINERKIDNNVYSNIEIINFI